jgi:hypothetical protein
LTSKDPSAKTQLDNQKDQALNFWLTNSFKGGRARDAWGVKAKFWQCSQRKEEAEKVKSARNRTKEFS